MRSDLPKVLHPLAGRPMLAHVFDAARALSPARIVVVVGHGGDAVRAAFPQADLQWTVQDPPHGTGHAVRQALPLLASEGSVLILYGDVPLVRPSSLRLLCAAADEGRLAIQTQRFDDPSGYGRVVRDGRKRVLAIVEDKDASHELRAIEEIYTGIMAAPAARLAKWVEALRNDNAQGEFYLTGTIAMAAEDGIDVATAPPDDPRETMGINSKAQLALVERALQQTQAEALLEAGVTLVDPARIDVRGTLQCGRDVSIDIGTIFTGYVELGDRVTIGAHCVVKDCRIGGGTVVHPFTHLDGVV
ncbi:MAG: NTP transferase domain-containing protein, partial [Betaproteobacteria bacterium]